MKKTTNIKSKPMTGLSPDTLKLINQNPDLVAKVLTDTARKRGKSGIKGLGRLSSRDKDAPVELLSFQEVSAIHNKGITDDEIKAWVWYRRSKGVPMKGWEMYYISGKEIDSLVKKGALFFNSETGLLPYPIYTYANIYDRQLQLEADKELIISEFGQAVYEQHKKVLDEVRPPQLSVMNPDPRERPKILAFSKFARDFTIDKTIRSDLPYSTSLRNAFSDYLTYLQHNEKSVFENVTAYQIWKFYVKGSRIPNAYTKDEKEIIEKYAPIEGEILFSRFLNKDLHVDDQQRLDTTWNRLYNGFSSIQYQRIPVGFECSSRFGAFDFNFSPIQREGMAFMQAIGSGIIAYDVGVGKTITSIITLANEMFAGKCKSPIIVVPNATYKKWKKEMFGYADEQSKAYFAGVLSGTGIKLNDWHNLGTDVLKRIEKEGVVKRQGEYGFSFKKLPDNSITLLTYEGLAKIGFGDRAMDDLFVELGEILAQEDKDNQKSKRDLNKELERFKEIVGISNKGSIVGIDELGADYLVVDEAHNFRNVFSYIPTDQEGNKRFDIQTSVSGRAMKAFFLTNYIQRTYRGNVMLLTATPFTNNPVEIYSMLSLVAHEALSAAGYKNIYNFLEAFILQSVEFVNNYDGTIKQAPVVKSFNNRLVLQKLIYNHINYKTGEEAGVKRPCKINIPKISYIDKVTGVAKKLPRNEQLTSFLKMTPLQQETQDYIQRLSKSGQGLAQRMANVMKALGKSLDNALSPYLVTGEIPETPTEFIKGSPKLDYVMQCIRSVKEYHEGRNEPVSGQVIYMNRGKEFFKTIKKYLEDEIGYKKKIKIKTTDGGFSFVDEVEIITSEVKNDDRELIKEAFLDGQCKVIIGTATIREGIDLQKKGTVLYNCYPDWNPTDIKQVEGRIYRQGNQFGYVRIVMPLVQDTMDVFVFQKLEEKSARVNEIWAKVNRGNVMDIDSLDPEEVKFALYSDVQELSKMYAEKDLTNIKRQLAVNEEQLEVLSQTKRAINSLIEQRERSLIAVQQWKIALQNIEDYFKNIYAFRIMSESELSKIRLKAAEVLLNIQTFQDTVPQDDKVLLGLYNQIKDTQLRWNGVLTANSYNWEEFKTQLSIVAKAERTVLKDNGIAVDGDISQLIEDLKEKRVVLNERAKHLRSDDYKAMIIAEIVRKKAENDFDGKSPQEAAHSFEKLNYLLQYKFNQTDTNGCQIPPDGSTTSTTATVDADKQKRLKIAQAKATAQAQRIRIMAF